MKLIAVFVCVVLISGVSYSQKKKIPVEVSLFGNADCYPKFTYVLNGRPSTDQVRINGISWGVDALVKIPVNQIWSVRIGAGFYKSNFNSIRRVNSSTGESKVRDIIYPSPLLINFYADRYSYNNLAGIVGVERSVALKNNHQFRLSADIYNYWTISQHYHLLNNPGGSLDFRRSNSGYFGLSGVVTAGYFKHKSKIAIGPFIRVPVFTMWKTDSVFPEETDNGNRTKLLRGVGLGICMVF